MAFTYDLATDRGKVRLLCTDTESSAALFTDDEIDAFLTLDSNVKRAAATVLERIAVSEVLIQKRIKLLDLQTDGPAEAEALRKLAASLRARADIDEADDADGLFDWAEMVVDPFSARERLWNEALRNG